MNIPIKSRDQIARMRDACAVAATVLESLKPLVRPGVTTQDLEEAGKQMIARLGASSACFGYQHGSRRYPAHTCISVNDEVVHGIPSLRRVLREGDLVSHREETGFSGGMDAGGGRHRQWRRPELLVTYYVTKARAARTDCRR